MPRSPIHIEQLLYRHAKGRAREVGSIHVKDQCGSESAFLRSLDRPLHSNTPAISTPKVITDNGADILVTQLHLKHMYSSAHKPFYVMRVY
jgi:hypothetical protein